VKHGGGEKWLEMMNWVFEMSLEPERVRIATFNWEFGYQSVKPGNTYNLEWLIRDRDEFLPRFFFFAHFHVFWHFPFFKPIIRIDLAWKLGS
jgi:hypothetical protein